ncbi:MAG: acetyltransferase [Sphingobium sp.]
MGDRRPLLILGAGAHGGVVRDCVDERLFECMGYVDDRSGDGPSPAGGPLLGRIDDLPVLLRDWPQAAVVIAVGDNMSRCRLAERVESIAPGLSWATVVHPTAILSARCEIGPGAVIVAGTIVNCGSRIGRHALINTGTIIDHDNSIGDFASTGPGVSTGGDVRIGPLSHIGIGASVRHGIRIGRNCVIGGKAYVDRDVEDDWVSFGVPARPRYRREQGQPYL